MNSPAEKPQSSQLESVTVSKEVWDEMLRLAKMAEARKEGPDTVPAESPGRKAAAADGNAPQMQAADFYIAALRGYKKQ